MAPWEASCSLRFSSTQSEADRALPLPRPRLQGRMRASRKWPGATARSAPTVRRAGIRPGWVSVLHLARQVKAAPQSEEPERYLFWGGAGQFVDLLARVSPPVQRRPWRLRGCAISLEALPNAVQHVTEEGFNFVRLATAILAERAPSPMASSHLHQASTHPPQEVRELGGAIVCGAPVRHISQSSSGVSVISDAGT